MTNRIAFLLSFLISATLCGQTQHSWIRINQLGYKPASVKVAVFVSHNDREISSFSLVDVNSGKEVFRSENPEGKGSYGPFASSFRLNFTEFTGEGKYFLEADGIKSPAFRISPSVYDHSADYLLRYMRQQRCGYNPFLADSCHVDDGYAIYQPNKEIKRIDVQGGWHDATDYLQYTATSANAVFQMLLAYRENPSAFGDAYQANGMPGPNGIPDVIDEAKHGLDWLKKMNPSPTEYYNQIADDRDHAGYRLPNKDSVIYDADRKGRPVYPVSDTPQGLLKYQNRSDGLASSTAKFSSAFALAAEVMQPFFPEERDELIQRARKAYERGRKFPGVSQTAPLQKPLFL